MKYWTIIIIAIAFFACRQKNDSKVNENIEHQQPVADSIIYEFISFITSNVDTSQSASFKLIVDKDLVYQPSIKDSIFLADLDTIFTKEDRVFILKQMKYIKYFSYNPEILRDKVIISADTLASFRVNEKGKKVPGIFWQKYEKKYGRIGFWTISMPLFSTDKSTVIIDKGYHCGGLCGYGGTYIYKKNNGKWILIKAYSEWVS